MSNLNYNLAKLSQLNYKISIHPKAANARLTSQIDQILVISGSIIPEQFKNEFKKLTALIDKSYMSAQKLGNGLKPYKLEGIQDRTAAKYIKLLIDIEHSLEDQVEVLGSTPTP